MAFSLFVHGRQPAPIAKSVIEKAPAVASPAQPTSIELPTRQVTGAGRTRFLDADVESHPGTIARLQPALRSIALERGELDLSQAAASSLRVSTPRYVVSMKQGHAIFAADGVRVLDGEVIVYSLALEPIATVRAGEAWHAQETSPAKAVARVPVTDALGHARSALAAGDVADARGWLKRIGATTQHERAEAELLGAESFLIERDHAHAITSYRHVAATYPSLPEGEEAAFAAAQMIYEQSGSSADSTAAFQRYLARYPEGRFAHEARARLDAPAP